MENLVLEFYGGVGDTLYAYNDKIVISHKGLSNAIQMGINGDKAVYYQNITAVQFKKTTNWTFGYIQFSIKGGNESIRGLLGARHDENTIKFIPQKNRDMNSEAEKAVAFINSKIHDIQNGVTQTGSSADELIKFKTLLDMGAITQEEFDAKKKQLLGL